MKNILTNLSNAIYVFLVLSLVFIVFMIPKCSTAQTRFITSDDFRGSKFRGFNLSLVRSYAELTAKNLPEARKTGANVGRYWIAVQHDASNVYSFTTSTTLTTLDSAVRQAEKIGFYLILTLQVKPDQAKCDLWGNQSRKDGVKKIWQQLASRYKGRKIIAAYDLINEPRLAPTTSEYVSMTIDWIKAIRAIDTVHTIAVEVLGNSMLGDYPQMDKIFKVYKNLVASPHGYSYLSLTHQGINAYLGSTASQSRATYPGTQPSNYFPNNSYWRVMIDFQKRYNVPVWVGEFSCVNWAPKNSKGEWTSTKWVDDVIQFMEANGISWCYHAWREFQAWDAEIPSSYYTQFTYKNAAPFTSSTKPSGWSSQRTSTAPTITMLRNKFLKNQPF